jgi:hypothetical protein
MIVKGALMKEISKIDKATQKKIGDFLMTNYGYEKIGYTQGKAKSYFMCGSDLLEVSRRPLIGAGKDVFHYSISSNSQSLTKNFIKNQKVVDFIFNAIRDINGLKYDVVSNDNQTISRIKVIDFVIHAFEGRLEDFQREYNPSVGFWVSTTGSERLSYVIVHADGRVNYAGAEITAKQFGEYLINDYAAYIAKIDEFFEHDGQHKTFDERVDDLKNTMMTKEMFAI